MGAKRHHSCFRRSVFMLPVDDRRARPRFLLAAAPAAGCSGGGVTTGEGGQSAAAPAGAGTNLRGGCPAAVVVRTSWFSQIEHFAAYQLSGGGYTVDAIRMRVTRPLVAGGVDTGVLLGTGQLRQSQVDGSHAGSPDRLGAGRGTIAVQGFTTSEPWKWQHTLSSGRFCPSWTRPGGRTPPRWTGPDPPPAGPGTRDTSRSLLHR
jgi:hypothetical protein